MAICPRCRNSVMEAKYCPECGNQLSKYSSETARTAEPQGRIKDAGRACLLEADVSAIGCLLTVFSLIDVLLFSNWLRLDVVLGIIAFIGGLVGGLRQNRNADNLIVRLAGVEKDKMNKLFSSP